MITAGAVQLLPVIQKWVQKSLVARGVKSVNVRVRGETLHAYRAPGTGTGAPLLLVHGLGGNANGFSRILLPLAQRFREVHAFDFPGNGFSPLPAAGPLPLLGQLALLHTYCVEQIGEPAFVVGNSLGGGMAIRLAADFPSDVRALGLVAPAGARVTQARFSALKNSMSVETPKDARALTEKLFHKAPFGARLLARELQHVYRAPAVRALAEEMMFEDLIAPEVLGALAMPVLLLWGESEKLLPYESLDYFRAHLPRSAQVEVVKGFGHVPQMERPVELVKRLVSFADLHGL